MNTTMVAPLSKLAKGKLEAYGKYKYGGLIVLTLQEVMVDEPTKMHSMAVDKHWRLYIRQKWIDDPETTVDEVADTLIHEVLHLMLRHFDRGPKIQPPASNEQEHAALWELLNLAADASIWAFIKPLSGALDKHHVTPAWLAKTFGIDDLREDQSFEYYFGKLYDAVQKLPRLPCGCVAMGGNTPQDGDGSENAQNGSGSTEGDEGQDGQGEGSEGDTGQSGKASGCTGACKSGNTPQYGKFGGSCADGQQRPWELEGEAAEKTPGVPEYVKQAVLKKTAENISKAGDAAGKHLCDWAKNILDPPVDPRKLVARLLGDAYEKCKGDSSKSYHRPHRRSRPGMLKPVLVDHLPKIRVILDSSGSMGDEDYALGVGMIAKILRNLRLRSLEVWTGDTELGKEQTITSYDQVNIVGGGGTDMGALIKLCAEEPKAKRPDLLLVITDGDTPWCKKVSIPTIVLLTRKRNKDSVPDWITTVCLQQ